METEKEKLENTAVRNFFLRSVKDIKSKNLMKYKKVLIKMIKEKKGIFKNDSNTVH